MLFKTGTKLFGYEVVKEGQENLMYINCFGYALVPSISDDAAMMARVIDNLIENPGTSRVILSQQKNYVYSHEETQILIEVANIYTYLIREERILGMENIRNDKLGMLNYLTLTLLRSDPIGCYVMANRLIREEKTLSRIKDSEYLRRLSKIYELLDKSSLIRSVKDRLAGFKVGTRQIYYNLFRPDVLPNFTFTRLVSELPMDAEIIDEYSIGQGEEKSDVTILKKKDEVKHFYHIMPPEFKLDEDSLMLLDIAKQVLLEHRPRAEEFLDPDRMRQVFFNIARDLLTELAQSKRINLDYKELLKLARILVRYTVGFGLIEILLLDDKLQDIVINAPIGLTQIFVRHADYDECVTNIMPSQEDAESWAAKFRMISGRPLDEAHPVLDTELTVQNISARVSIIQEPLSPYGLAYAIRRFREKPWTLPLFVKIGMMSPLAAGLFSFLIDGSRTMLIAGTRSSGKTSLLGSLLFELMPKYRVIVIEDTLELPVEALRKLGYDVQRMKVRAALLKETTEVAADEGIRTSLRLGDSVLIIGEVRSLEAKALYEAMRVGALANTVAGTIHGASPYAIFDRVVNDLQVPVTSFKATDIIAVANPIKSPDGMHSWRRLVQISEVRKNWKEDPLAEKGFVDLMKYNAEKDELEPTDELINGESETLKSIAGNVKEWAGNWDAIWDNIQLRAKIKETLVRHGDKIPDLLEAPFIVKSNNAFHNLSDSVLREHGSLDSKRIFEEWNEWLRREIKRAKV
ncbi:MAG: Flp pilus assembly complex ATPase component TadA [Nanoarchaeota archaeon]|nr:Flp pilus assembly complex ATPase component TadA [Nanoarchaeota archaeon]